MITTRRITRRIPLAVATVAVGAAAGATTYLLIPPASAGVEATKASTSLSAAAGDKDKGGPGCGPFAGWGSGEMPAWVEDRLDDLPADLRADLEAAWKIEDRSERRDALREIWQAARDGEYGAEVADLVEDGPFGHGWGPGRGWGPGGHRGPWGR
jgi:hypothetical protein